MKISLISTVMLSMLFVGCGGSSHNSSKGSSSVSSTVAVIPASSAVTTSSSVSSVSAVLTGVFLDAAVKNIGYRTATEQGFTKDTGEFNYRAGELITFFIGNLELPSVVAGDIITPMNIANTNNMSDHQLVNILRLLQSLDADGDASNGIEITAAAIAAGTTLDFTVAPEIFAQSPAVQSLLQAAGGVNKELVSTEQAVAHFQTTLEFINGPASSSSQSSVAVVGSSSSAASSIDSGSSTIRLPKMEGFAAYAGVTGGAGGTVFTVSTGTELNAALCGSRSKKKSNTGNYLCEWHDQSR